MKKITQEQLIKAREELEEMYRDFYKQEYGIDKGVIVIDYRRNSKRHGCDYRVEEVLVDLNRDPLIELKCRPNIRVTMMNKNGTWGKDQFDLGFSSWKLKD